MEPASLRDAETHGHQPREGSIDNPEILENVPGHVIPILAREFDDFDTESTRFLEGRLEEDEFIKFRLKQGVYGQRQPNVQMVRVKLPMGGVTPDQLDAFADVIERYVPLRKGHVTTRQNIQMHHIPLDDAAKLIRELGDAGLSSREGCGNTMRNVTGDPRAGVLPGELFDITPYAGAYVRYFVRHPTTQAMPRKVKTAFTATDDDNAITRIHDIAFIPRVRDGVRGVEIRVGGGTSIMPRLAPTLYEFVELDNGDYLKVTEACMRIFDRQDFLRVNRARARIKVLIDKIGIDAFREHGRGGARGRLGRASATSRSTGSCSTHDEQAQRAGAARAGRLAERRPARVRPLPRDATSQPQRQPASSTVEVKVRRGDLTPEQLRGLGADHARLQRRLRAHDRPSEPRAALGSRRVGLRRLAAPGRARARRRRRRRDHRRRQLPRNRLVQARHHQLDGAQPCGPGAARRRCGIDDELTRRIHVKMSGCPNGCGQHHIANIGFYGASIKVGEHTIPAYIPHIGGAYEGGDVRYGAAAEERGCRPSACPRRSSAGCASTSPSASDGEEFNAFADRVGTEAFEEQVKDLAMPVEFSLENMNFHRLDRRAARSQVERGEGECAV